MKRLVRLVTVLAWVLAATSATAAGPVLAQQPATEAQGSSAAMIQTPGEVTPDPPDFVLSEEGFVIVDGDVGTSCPDFARDFEDDGALRTTNLDQEMAQSVLAQCEQAGFLTSGGPPAPVDASTGERLDYRELHQLTPAQLPATGGSVSLLPALVGGVLLMPVLGFATVARRRR